MLKLQEIKSRELKNTKIFWGWARRPSRRYTFFFFSLKSLFLVGPSTEKSLKEALGFITGRQRANAFVSNESIYFCTYNSLYLSSKYFLTSALNFDGFSFFISSSISFHTLTPENRMVNFP